MSSSAADMLPSAFEGQPDPECLFLWALAPMGHNSDVNNVSMGFPPQCFNNGDGVGNETTFLLMDGKNISKANMTMDSMDYGSHILKLAKKRSKADDFKTLLNFLNLYITPFIIAIGLIGNIISFLVFSMTHLKRLSSSIYLAALSVADTGFLLSLTVVWLSRIDVPIFHSQIWCQLTIYMTHFFSFLSVWFVVSFTAERYIIVYHPLRKDSYCTRRKAKIVIGSLTVVALVLYCWTVVTSGVVTFHTKSFCMPLPQYYDVLSIMTSIDTFLAWVLPSLLIVVLNVRIIIKLQSYQRRCAELTKASITASLNHNAQIQKQQNNETAKQQPNRRKTGRIRTSISTTGSMHIRFSSSHNKENDNNNAVDFHTMEIAYPESCQKVLRNRTQFRTARMLLILSSVFVLLNLPSHVFRIYTFVESVIGNDGKSSKGKVRWQELFHLVYFLNFAVNFFVYSACGRQFRTGMARLCKRCSRSGSKCKIVLRPGSQERTKFIGTKNEIKLNGTPTENLKQINFV